MKKLFIYALAMVGQAAFAIGPNEVCIYENAGYNGNKSCYSLDTGTDQKDISFLDSFNDKASSIELGSNVNAELFEHGSFGGQKWSYDANNSWLGGQNDLASSMKIITKAKSQVCLYEHGNYQGEKTCWDYKGVIIDIPWLGNFNDKASSITLPTGVSVLGYQHGYFGGASWLYNQNTAYFSNNDNDQLSSIKITPGSGSTFTEVKRAYINFIHKNNRFQWLADNLYNGGAISTATGSTINSPNYNSDEGKWIITTNKEIRSVANPNLCVGRETPNNLNANVNLYNCDGSSLQKWKFAMQESSLNDDPNRISIKPVDDSYKFEFYCTGGFAVKPVNRITSCYDIWAKEAYFRIDVIN